MTETEDDIFHRGTAPLCMTMPRTGTATPAHIANSLTPEAQSVPDTDWHIEKLYAFAKELWHQYYRPRGIGLPPLLQLITSGFWTCRL